MTYSGLVHGLDENEYHSLPGLSSTGAKKILESPATYQHYVSTPHEDKDEFDVGSAAHAKILGVGASIAVYPDGDGPETFEFEGEELTNVLAKDGGLRTKSSAAFAAEARSRGLIPVKRVVSRVVDRMAEAVLSDPIARAALSNGQPEVSMFATDPATGIDLRGRLDYLGKRIVDVKTTAGKASEHGFAKSVYDYGYDVQHGFYEHIYNLITGDSPEWVWVVVEVKAPYLVGVHRLGTEEIEMGREKARIARERFARARDRGFWPGYTSRTGTPVGIIQAPWWAIAEFEALKATEREAA